MAQIHKPINSIVKANYNGSIYLLQQLEAKEKSLLDFCFYFYSLGWESCRFKGAFKCKSSNNERGGSRITKQNIHR